MTREQQMALDLVKKSLGATRIGQVVLGLLCLGLSALGTLGFNDTLAYKVLAGLLVPLFASVSVFLFYLALFRSSPGRSPLIVALRERPDDVVWIYQQSVAVNVKGIAAPVRKSNVIVGLVGGKKYAMTVAKAKAEDLFVALTQLAPAAATGFSVDREAQFKQDPQSLLGAGNVAGSNMMQLG